jgi:hypothetical protein
MWDWAGVVFLPNFPLETQNYGGQPGRDQRIQQYQQGS